MLLNMMLPVVEVKPTARLPEEYQEVEYIQSSGTQYIDTGFVPSNNTRVVMDFEFTAAPSSYAALCGVRIAPRQGNYVFVWHTSGYFRSDYNNSESQTWAATAIGRWALDKNKETTTFNGTSLSYTNSAFSSTYNLYLLARNSKGTADCKAAAKLYSCQMYDNGTLVRDFVPCYRKADSTAGLYNLVSGAFYTNAGSGSFAVGADVFY